MILKWMLLGIPTAGFFAAGVLAAQAEPAKTQTKAEVSKPAADAGTEHRVVKLRVVKNGETSADDGAGKTLILDGEDIAGDVDEIVHEALSDAMAALEEAEAEIRVELDGKKLKALSEEHRKALDQARDRLEGMSERIAERMAEVEVRVEKAAEQAASAAEAAGEKLRERRVVILRDADDGDAQIEVKKDGDGRTVVIIEGDDVKVITKEQRTKKDKADESEE